MIGVYESLPRKYYADSRDFQFIGRVFEAAFNYMKMNADLARKSKIPSECDVRMLPLLAKTLGFDSKHEYNTEDFRALCSSFVGIVRKKGSIEGITEAIKAFLSAQNIELEAYPDRNESDYMDLRIFLPTEVKDTSLLEDVFDYILPAGMTYNFVYATSVKEPSTTEMTTAKSGVWHKTYGDASLGEVSVSGANADRPDRMLATGEVPDAADREAMDSLSTFALGKVVGKEDLLDDSPKD